MNIKLLDSWIKDYLKTDAAPKKIAEILSLTSVSIERLEKHGADFTYDIEVTTNRPDLMSIIGLAREAGAILPQEEIDAKFVGLKLKEPSIKTALELRIINDPKLVNRICAIALEINLKPSPEKISERLETSDIRSINNAVDVTNYVMREVGHPMHVFDYDKLLKTGRRPGHRLGESRDSEREASGPEGKMIIRLSKPGEKIQTLDNKEYVLNGGDIVADDGTGRIIDLLGVMGTLNSAVDETTKRVMLFVDNNDQHRIRKTSMSLGIRTEAAILNEKGVDPELADDAILRGVELLEEIANGKVISALFDEYPNKVAQKSVSVSQEKINSVIGVEIPIKTSEKILKDLGFEVTAKGEHITAKVPSWRANDVDIPEDLIEEVARVYGYAKLPSVIPPLTGEPVYNQEKDLFYWEKRVRNALKYWGFTEVYTYPMVSENMLEGPTEEAVTIKNPLTEDHIYMRRTLVPSLLEVLHENKNREIVNVFEIANVYLKKEKKLPDEKLMLGAVLKKEKINFLEAKGIVQTLLKDLGINNVDFKSTKSGGSGADVYISSSLRGGQTTKQSEFLGEIEILEEDVIDFELDFEILMRHANIKKIYKPTSKFPEAVEDLRFEIDETIPYEKIVHTIVEQDKLIKEVSLLDVYKNKKTFRIIYQSPERNLTTEDLTPIREKIIAALKKSHKAEPA